MHYKQYKHILSPSGGMNLYRGCTHGCIYCDSRSRCYQFDHDFEDIEVKTGSAEMLETELRRKRKRCMIGTGAMCDPYLHLEETLLVTRRSLELIEKYGFGLAIQTKSTRILRDLDLLEAINEKAKCVVQFTLTTFDDELCGIVEPNVSRTSERIAALEILKKRGIPTVVWLTPLLPWITDSVENLNGILDACIETGVKGILNFGFGVTLREGDREYFYSKLDAHFPGLKRRYISTFGNSYQCMSDNNALLHRVFLEKTARSGILNSNDEIFAYLHKFETKNAEQLTMF
ncbi:MAG: radical SAM protein [Oscillospiraceae bacterium]|jgi:DNA repair photolyase|nr:radical SAM protein [Oscillospiraceae bacterium]